MVDVVSPEKRSRMMSGIRGKNTKPEMLIRKELFRRGYRYRLHVKNIFGKPDLVFSKYRAVIFIDGCFWHHHDCHLFKWPGTRVDFWKEKIGKNVQRDLRVTAELRKSGWRILRIYECALKGKTRLSLSQVIDKIHNWLDSDVEQQEIYGS